MNCFCNDKISDILVIRHSNTHHTHDTHDVCACVWVCNQSISKRPLTDELVKLAQGSFYDLLGRGLHGKLHDAIVPGQPCAGMLPLLELGCKKQSTSTSISIEGNNFRAIARAGIAWSKNTDCVLGVGAVVCNTAVPRNNLRATSVVHRQGRQLALLSL